LRPRLQRGWQDDHWGPARHCLGGDDPA
jgi:hypothetical protein